MAKDKKVGSPIIAPSINMDAFKAALDRVARIEHHNPDVREQALKIAKSLLTPTGQFSAKDTGRYYNIKHNINPADVQTTIGNIPGVKLKKPKNMSWEDFYKEAKGGTLINIGGDRSNLGRLTHINGQELAWPVDLHAGAKYMQEPNPGAVWANNATHGSALQNQILKAAEKGPVYGAFTPMGPGSVDSSHNMFDAVMAQIPNSKISKTDAKDFDEMIRGGYHVPVPNSKDPEKVKKAQAKRQRVAEIMQEWPGIMNAKQAAEFARNLNGDQRKDIIQFMDQGKYLKAGFPEIGVTRAAITDPALLATPGNMIGHRIVKFDPNNLAPASKKFEHSTYTTNTGGQYVGDVPLIQRHYAMPDVTEQLLAKPTSAGDIVHPYSLDQHGRGTSRKMFEEQKQMQPINDKMINSIGEGQRLQEKYGFAHGGEVEPVHIMHQHFGHPIFTGVEHKAGGGEVDQGQDSMTAYHGSPHNFDKFQTSQIGTGEGAQSFGHGLYFAQNEKVAKNYRDNLAGQNTYLIDHILQHAPELKNADSNTKMDLHKWAMNEKYDPHTAAKWAQAGNSYLRQIDPTRIANVLSSYKNAARGHMYEVGIKAHPDDFLDWDDYRANQSNTVNRAVRKLIEDKINKENPSNDQKNRYLSMGLTGRDLYSLIHEDPKEAARLLHEHGVKGIRYLDELSRHKDDDDEDKTHNYVVFNDKDVDIKRKYERGGRVRFSQGGTDSYDYRGEHQAPGPEDGAPLHDLTKVYPDDVYGPNGFQYYGETGDPSDRTNFSLVQSMRGKPNASVTMYRAVPNVPSVAKELAKLEEDMANYQRRGRLPRDAWTTDKSRWYDSSAHQRNLLREKAEKEKLNPPKEIGINAGDWVTTNRQYAKDHGESALNGNYKILTKKAKAKELFTAGDSHHEWGYYPEKKAEGGAVNGYEGGGEVDRRQMHHKDVTERVPQLTEGANKLAQGEIDKHEYQRLVNQHKPVHPYESVPAPATHEEMYAALQENKRDKLGQAENIPEGHPVGLRLDIPAYKDHGVWVPTIHNQSDHKTIAHGSHAMVSDATFKIPQNKALKVATGTAKSPFATIDGNFNHISHEDAIQLAAHALNHPEWTQVGMDPERHGFFYDRRTQRPVKNAAKVLQVGPLVLAHHAELGDLSDPEYHYALGGNVGHRVHFPSLSAVYD